PRALELHPVPLPVVHEEAAAEEPFAPRDLQDRLRVQDTREKKDRAPGRHCCRGLPWTETRMVQDWHSGRQPASEWFRTWISSSVTPQTRGKLHTQLASSGTQHSCIDARHS